MKTDNDPLEVPYRLETKDDIAKVMKSDLLNIGDNYARFMHVARMHKLTFPPAFQTARGKVEKHFFKLREEVVREANVQYEEIEGLDFMNNFELIERQFAFATGMAKHEHMYSFLRTMSSKVTAHCGLELTQSCPSAMAESYLALKRLIRRELLSYVRSKRTRVVTIDELKVLIAALAMFDKNNQDVLNAIKTAPEGKSEKRGVLLQNALAELLFSRIPASMDELITLESDTIRDKVFSKIAKMDMNAKQRTILFSYYKMGVEHKKVIPTLEKMQQIAQRINLADNTKMRFSDYIKVLTENIKKRGDVYHALFLDKELERLQKLYVPRAVMKQQVSYQEVLRRTYTERGTISFFPTKDYMDLWHGRFSSDCVGFDLAQKHLLTRRFFNIRLFIRNKWAGNIYMLDFTEQGILLIDRIQVPRNIPITFMLFFEKLAEVFQEMFSEVEYKEILIPMVVSNHDKIQKVFNSYKDSLQKKIAYFDVDYLPYFESLSNQNVRVYYVLCTNSKDPSNSAQAAGGT